MFVKYRTFKGAFKSWETLLAEASAFASELDPDKLISISQSSALGDWTMVTVWYWK